MKRTAPDTSKNSNQFQLVAIPPAQLGSNAMVALSPSVASSAVSRTISIVLCSSEKLVEEKDG